MLARLEHWLREKFGFAPNASLLNQLGMRLFEQGRTAEAVAQFERAIAAAPYFAAAWINMAGCRATLGDQAAAVEGYTQAIEIDPRIMVAWNGRGLAQLQLLRYAEAHADFQQALALAPDDLDLVFNRGVAAAGAGWPDRAIADMCVVIAREPQRAAPYQQRGLALVAQGRGDDALSDLRRATQLDPSLAEAWRELGTLHYFRGEPAAAVEASTRCLALAPGDSLAANNRGCAHFLLGRFAEAEADLERAIAAHPQFASPKKNLAWLRATCPDKGLRDGREAVQLATQALEMTHWDQPQWLEVLAAAEAERGDFEAAVSWQTKAIEANSADGLDGPAQHRLGLYESQQPFRHECLQPPRESSIAGSAIARLELIPGCRNVPYQEFISRA